VAPNMFANAKKVADKAPAAKKGKDRAQVEIVGLETYASIDSVIKALETLKKTNKTEIDAQLMQHFITEGAKTGRQPENFDGSEGDATGSMQLRLRSSRSPLAAEEQDLLAERNIPMGTEVDVVERFVINEAYSGDQELLKKVSKALEKVPGMPADFIMLQEGKSRTVATQASIDAIFATREIDTISKLLGLVTLPAVRAKLATDDFASAFAVVTTALGFGEEEETEENDE